MVYFVLLSLVLREVATCHSKKYTSYQKAGSLTPHLLLQLDVLTESAVRKQEITDHVLYVVQHRLTVTAQTYCYSTDLLLVQHRLYLLTVSIAQTYCYMYANSIEHLAELFAVA